MSNIDEKITFYGCTICQKTLCKGDKMVKRAGEKPKIEACQNFIQYRLEQETIINISDLLKEIKRSRKCSVKKDMTLQEFIVYLLFNEYPDRETVIFQYNGEVLICLASDFGEMWEDIKKQKNDK